jgi:tetratricopeptide (TPR) repeat protein
MMPCPDPETLRALIAGRLSGVTLGAAAAHVDRCPDCLGRVHQLDPGFDPVRAIQNQAFIGGPEPERARTRRWVPRKQTLVTAVITAAITAVLLGGLGWWWLERKAAWREDQNRQAIETALEQAEQFLREARWAEAEAALAQAAGRLANGGPEDLQQRLRQAQEDLRLVKRLDVIRLEAATLIEGKWNPGKAVRAYEAAFKEHGLDVLAWEEAELGRRMAPSSVKGQLVAALEDWAGMAAEGKTQGRLLALVRRADPDPLRNRLRDPAVWQDRRQLTRLAAHAGVEHLSPALLLIVGSRLEQLGGPGLELLERGQRRYPGDFWLNFELANALHTKKHARCDEAAGYYRAALAVRPGTVAVYNNLGIALHEKKDLDGAIAAFRQAIALDPKFAQAHYNLGTVLKARGDRAGANAAFRRAIALDPKLAQHKIGGH